MGFLFLISSALAQEYSLLPPALDSGGKSIRCTISWVTKGHYARVEKNKPQETNFAYSTTMEFVMKPVTNGPGNLPMREYDFGKMIQVEPTSTNVLLSDGQIILAKPLAGVQLFEAKEGDLRLSAYRLLDFHLGKDLQTRVNERVKTVAMVGPKKVGESWLLVSDKTNPLDMFNQMFSQYQIGMTLVDADRVTARLASVKQWHGVECLQIINEGTQRFKSSNEILKNAEMTSDVLITHYYPVNPEKVNCGFEVTAKTKIKLPAPAEGATALTDGSVEVQVREYFTQID